MNRHRSAYHIQHSDLYQAFLEIEDRSYHQIIRFYERHEEGIEYLEEEERFDLLEEYTTALFEVGAHKRHLELVDRVIEESVQANIIFYKGEDILQKMLFRKAASLFHLMKWSEADRILCELIRINPAYRDAIAFLKRCRRRAPSTLINRSRAAGILLFILAALVISVEVLYLRHFAREMVDEVEQTRLGLFSMGCLSLLAGNIIQRLRVEVEVNEFVAEARRRKNWDQ